MKNYILDIACKGKTVLKDKDIPMLEVFTLPLLAELEKDGLVELMGKHIQVTLSGKYFLRNICAAFDQYLHLRSETNTIFSKAI